MDGALHEVPQRTAYTIRCWSTRDLPSKAGVTTSARKWSCVPVRSAPTCTVAPGKAARRRDFSASGLGIRLRRPDAPVGFGRDSTNSVPIVEAPDVERTAVWPDATDAWVIHDDGVLLVVDKPAGVASQAAEATRPDDVVTRLRAYLSRGRGGADGEVYLGVHQRLDQATSGVMVYARRKEANARLAAQFEGRGVKKTYLACVTGWTRGKDQVTLRDALRAGQGRRDAGRPRRARDSAAKLAVTHVKVVARQAARAMLELSARDGAHAPQARVQLAHAGAPIGGDTRLCRGARAPRLLLHASALALDHPTTGKHVRFVAKTPPQFEEWLRRGDLGEAVYEEAGGPPARGSPWPSSAAGATRSLRVDHRLPPRERRRRRPVPPRRRTSTTAGWWRSSTATTAPGGTPHDAPAVSSTPSSPWASTASTSRSAPARPTSSWTRAARTSPPRFPVRGTAAPTELTVLEEGLPLLVRLGDGLSTGLFLDQRGNRARVRALAGGKSVANLFAYTCASHGGKGSLRPGRPARSASTPPSHGPPAWAREPRAGGGPRERGAHLRRRRRLRLARAGGQARADLRPGHPRSPQLLDHQAAPVRRGRRLHRARRVRASHVVAPHGTSSWRAPTTAASPRARFRRVLIRCGPRCRQGGGPGEGPPRAYRLPRRTLRGGGPT